MVLKMHPSEGAEKLITREEVVALAADIAHEVVRYYKQDDRFVVTEEAGERGKEYQVYSKELLPPSTVPNYQQHSFAFLQRLTFRDETLVEAESSPYSNENNRYFLDEDGVLWLGRDAASPRWRLIRARFDDKESRMQEVSSLHRSTILSASYAPAVQEGIKGFDLVDVSLGASALRDIPLPNNDVAKFLPAGRFISLEALVRTVVDPYRANERFHQAIPEVIETEAFPKFDRDSRLPGIQDYEALRSDTWNPTTNSWNRGGIEGNAHSLKTEKAGQLAWLVFVIFTDEDGTAHARTLNVAISTATVATGITIENVPTITGTVDIEGEQYKLELPEDRITFVNEGGVGNRKVDAVRVHEDGSKGYTVHINADDLSSSVAKGYYYNDLLKGALELYRQKHYTGQEQL